MPHTSMYMTLPSNTSDFQDVNRTNSFRVRLPEPVQLFGAWEVALVDMQYPCSWRNLAGKQEVTLKYRTSNGFTTRLAGLVPPGYYRDVATLLDGVRLGIRDAARSVPVTEAMEELVMHRLSILQRFPRPATLEGVQAEVNDLVEVDEGAASSTQHDNFPSKFTGPQ